MMCNTRLNFHLGLLQDLRFLAGLLLITSITGAQMASAMTPCKVPLKLVNINAGSGKPPEYKLGIYVGLGGGVPQLYELDTGGPGFWAAYTATPPQKKGQWWGDYRTVQADALTVSYTSGNQYQASLVETVVALYRPRGKGFAIQCKSEVPVGVAQINSFEDTQKPKNKVQWDNALATGTPPLFGNFYGDFGAALYPIMTADGSQGVYSVLPQLPQNGMNNGFIVHVGPLKSAQPSLTIGITQEERATFRTQISMNPTCMSANGAPAQPSSSCPPYPGFPGSNLPVKSEQIANANLSWAYTKGRQRPSQAFQDVGLTLDTGAPATTIWQDDTLLVNPIFLSDVGSGSAPYSGNFKSNARFRIRAANIVERGRDLDFLLQTGHRPTVNLITASVRGQSGKGPSWSGYLNTGLMIYTHYDVMFDLERGVVGFRDAK